MKQTFLKVAVVHLFFDRPGRYLSRRLLAPAKLALAPAASGVDSNWTVEFDVADVSDGDVDDATGRHLCLVLPLQLPNQALATASAWDDEACTAVAVSAARWQCRCTWPGATLLLYVTDIPRVSCDDRPISALFLFLFTEFLSTASVQEDAERSANVWPAVWLASALGQLASLAGLLALSTRWYCQRSVWSWLNLQLAPAVLPLSASYLVPAKEIVRFQVALPFGSAI